MGSALAGTQAAAAVARGIGGCGYLEHIGVAAHAVGDAVALGCGCGIWCCRADGVRGRGLGLPAGADDGKPGGAGKRFGAGGAWHLPLDAQSHVSGFCAGFAGVVAGAGYVERGAVVRRLGVLSAALPDVAYCAQVGRWWGYGI